LANLPGNRAIGHTRYSTTGETALRNVQPLFAELEVGGIAIAHNGNLTNGLTIRRQLIASGAICQSTSDSEVVLHLIARSRHAKSSERFVDAIRQIEGGFAMIAMTRSKLIAARDPVGIRPLVMGELDGKPIFCSETCALDIIGAKYIRDVEKWEALLLPIMATLPTGSQYAASSLLRVQFANRHRIQKLFFISSPARVTQNLPNVLLTLSARSKAVLQ